MADQFPSDTLREIADRARLALGADRALVLPVDSQGRIGSRGLPALTGPSIV